MLLDQVQFAEICRNQVEVSVPKKALMAGSIQSKIHGYRLTVLQPKVGILKLIAHCETAGIFLSIINIYIAY